MRGWVYVISTKTHNLLKVGYTDRDPEVRAKELNDTSSPHPHVVEYAALVNNPRYIESAAHRKLQYSRESKEWFNCELKTTILIIRDVAGQDAILFEEFSRSARDVFENTSEETQKAQELLDIHLQAQDQKRIEQEQQESTSLRERRAQRRQEWELQQQGQESPSWDHKNQQITTNVREQWERKQQSQEPAGSSAVGSHRKNSIRK